MAKKVTSLEDKIQIRNFKDGSSHWWVRDAHYYLSENNELLWGAGETDKPELREALIAYIKRNKKSFKSRAKSQIDEPQKEYLEKMVAGKYIGLSVQYVFEKEKKYLTWMYKNYTFNSAQEKLKQEIKEILKIK